MNHGNDARATTSNAITAPAAINTHFSMAIAPPRFGPSPPSLAHARVGGGSTPPAARVASLRRDQQDLAGRVPTFERPVRFGGLREREFVLEPKLELAVTDPAEDVVRALHQLFPRRNVVVQARPCHEERAARVDDLQVE